MEGAPASERSEERLEPTTLASAATSFFKAQEYGKCVVHLERLLQLKEDDPNVRMNCALAAYLDGSCRDALGFIGALERISPFVNGQAAAKDDESDGMYEDLDASLINYNKAIILLQLRQYARASAILDTLFRHIEPLDESVAIRICFMRLECLLFERRPDRADTVTRYLEKNFGYLVTRTAEDGAAAGGSVETETAQPAQPTTVLVAPAPSLQPQRSHAKAADSSGSAAPFEMRFHMHMYKAKVHLLNRSMKLAKRDIKCAIVAAAGSPALLQAALMLKAQLEYLRDNRRKATKLLTTSQKSGASDPYFNVLYFNNLACIHFRWRKFHAATHYLLNALKANQEQASAARLTAHQYAHDKTCELEYNMGLQLLLTGHAEIAFQCFQHAALLLHNQPALWLRIAECCIAANIAAPPTPPRGSAPSDRRTLALVGSSAQTRRVHLPLRTASQLYSHASALLATREESLVASEEPPPRNYLPPRGVAHAESEVDLTLQYARTCLQNCILLLNRSAANSGAHAKPPAPAAAVGAAAGATAGGGATGATAAGTEEEGAKDDGGMRVAAFLNLAYVHLSLCDASAALKAAKTVLDSKTGVTDTFRFLAHLYAAEALCLLHRPAEAAAHLAPTILPAASAASSAPQPSQPSGAAIGVWSYSDCPTDLASPAARALLYLNLAAVHILQDNLGHASAAVTQAISVDPSNSRAILTAAYLEMRKGKVDAGLQILRRRRLQPIARPAVHSK